jgi:hypothetical protein
MFDTIERGRSSGSKRLLHQNGGGSAFLGHQGVRVEANTTRPSPCSSKIQGLEQGPSEGLLKALIGREMIYIGKHVCQARIGERGFSADHDNAIIFASS